MQIYCKNWKKKKKTHTHTGNMFPKKWVLISKNKIKGKSKCATCLTERTFIDEIKDEYDLVSELEVYLQFFTDCVKGRENTENLNLKIFKTKNGGLVIQSKCTEWW